MEQKLGRHVCRSEVILSTLRKKDRNYVNDEGKQLVDKISNHLPQDQERTTTVRVPSKVLAHPNYAIRKVYGAEHLGRVHGLGVDICPSTAFEKPRHSIGYVNFSGSSTNVSQHVEDLVKHVETLEEKLIGYKETKEQLAQIHSQLAILHKFLQDKFGSELPI